MDLTGRHLGKYELLQRVGQGGMAYVYKAYQPTIDRFVAVKVLHSHLAEDAEFLERFKREARGLGQLRHPHIVNVIDFDVDDGWYYMVMDFIEGETLEATLNRRGPLTVAEALRLAAQLAGALDYAHRHGRIHRDVKPSNIMFADTAQQHVVITDFGLTRLLDNATLTMSGTVASPEQKAAQTQLLPADTTADYAGTESAVAESTAPTSADVERKRPFLPFLLGSGLLLGLVIIGLLVLFGSGEGAAAEVTAVSPAATVLVEATETAAPVAAGSLRFAGPDDDGLRPYTLTLDDVPPPPANTRYQLWFDFAGRTAPVNVAALTEQDGRITYADMLVDDLATTVAGVRISIEPSFDDDPSISTNVMFTGTIDQGTGLAEIQLFAIER